MHKFVLLLVLLLMPGSAFAQASPSTPFPGAVDIGNHIVLHYTEAGAGIPIVFVHGSISDMTYWTDQIPAFAKKYRAIAYSRRYNFPNDNPSISGYSAITDANDLAAFIGARHLGKVYIVGHSYGALTALYLAIHHPEMIRAMVLAEPPAVPLLEDVKGKDRAKALAMYADIERRLIEPMQRDFDADKREAGVADFIDYMYDNPDKWAKAFTAEDRALTMRDAHEWDVMMTKGTLFPPISAREVANIHVPTLVMSGGVSYPFLAVIDTYLAKNIPHAQSVVYPDAGHQMWLQHPDEARAATESFFSKHHG